MLAAEGVGSLVGAAQVTRLGKRLGSGRAVLAAITFASVAVLLVPLATAGWGLALFALGNAGFGAGVVVVSVLTRTHRQTATPRELLPRVMASVRFVSWGAIPLGALAAGVASTALGVRGALWAVCAVVLLAPLTLALSPVRGLRDLDN